MKCKSCGGNLSLEVMYCPYCGALNEEAKQHVEDMAKYAKEFEDTKEDVYESTKRFSGFSVRMIVLAIIVIIGIGFFMISHNLYGLQRMLIERKAVSNKNSYFTQIDEYLVNDEFLALYTFSEEHDLTYLEEYESYYMVLKTARAYKDCYQDIVILIDDHEREYSSMYCSELADSLKRLYRYSSKEEYQHYDSEVTSEDKMDSVEKMKTEINGMLKAYLHFSDDEIEELMSASDGKRVYMLENALYGEEGGDDQYEENE